MFSLRKIARTPLMSLPLTFAQPFLRHMLARTAKQRPELFARLGPCCNKCYLIDPINLPFVFLLQPNPHRPVLKALRRGRRVAYDARIAGRFLSLLDMLEARLDGDSLFFTRDLIIEGDTEAVVTLRNACDDLDGSVVDDLLLAFGPFSRPARIALDRIYKRTRKNHAP